MRRAGRKCLHFVWVGIQLSGCLYAGDMVAFESIRREEGWVK